MARPAAAQELTYTLNNVALSDGAFASGYFDYDLTTDTFGAFDLTTTDGQTDTQQGAHYMSGAALSNHLTFDASGKTGTTFQFINLVGQSNDLILDTYDAVGTMGTLSLIPGTVMQTSNLFGSGEYTYPPGGFTASIRGITSGSLKVTEAAKTPSSNPVPEASTTISFGLLLALGMGSIVTAAKKKTAMSA